MIIEHEMTWHLWDSLTEEMISKGIQPSFLISYILDLEAKYSVDCNSTETTNQKDNHNDN